MHEVDGGRRRTTRGVVNAVLPGLNLISMRFEPYLNAI